MNFLEKSAAKSMRKRFITLLIVLAALLYAATFFISDYRALVFGHPVFESNKIADSMYLQKMYGVMSIYTADMENSGYYEITEEKSKSGRSISSKETAWYYLAKVNNAYFIVKTNVSEFGDTEDNVKLTAVLHGLSDFSVEAVDRTIYDKMLADTDFRDVRDLIVPNVMLYTKSQSNQALFAYGLAAVILFVLICLMRIVIIYIQPLRHVTLKFAQANFGSLQSLAATLERENQLGLISQFKGITFYKDYLVVQGKSRFEMFKIADLLWVYVEEESQKILYLITVHTTRKMVVFEQKRQRKFFVSKPEMNFILETLIQRRPDLLVGYDKDLLKAWKKNPAQFVELVNAR